MRSGTSAGTRRGRLLRCAAVAALAALCLPAWGQQQDDRRAKEAMRRLQSANQKLESEKSQLQQQADQLQKQKSELEGKVKVGDGLRKQLAAAKKREDAAAAELAALKQTVAKAEARIAQQDDRIRALQQQLAESQQEGRRLGSELKQAQAQLQEQRAIVGRQSQAIQALDEKNQSLYQLSGELIAKYKDKGVWDSILQREPMTQIKDVRIQAVAQEYQDRAESLKAERTVLTGQQ